MRLLGLMVPLLLVLPPTLWAEIGLNQQVSYDIPSLTGTIRAWDLNDIDHDGTPEILAADSTTLVVYSWRLDSVFTVQSIPTGWSRTSVLLADINRDSVADVVIGGNFDSTTIREFRIRSFDGASGFSAVSQRRHFATGSYTGLESIGLITLQAVDIDSDGYNELYVSFDSMATTVITDYTAGLAYLYHAFPDSVRSRRPVLTTDLTPWIPRNDTALFLTHEYYRYYSQSGNDYTYSLLLPYVVDAAGDSIASFDTQRTGTCFGWEFLYSRIDELKVACRGDLDPAIPGDEVLLFFLWGYQCDFIGESGARLESRRLVAADSLEALWQTPLDLDRYRSFLFYPGYPGLFFGIDEIDRRVTQFDGSDGSVRQTSAALPGGSYSWIHSYPDSLPRLMVLDSLTVAIYTLDVATGVDDTDSDLPLPVAFSITGPYPNPFNPATTVSLSLPRAGRLTVAVFDLLGREVTVLHDGYSAAGDIELVWDARNVSSGVYFIRARLDETTRSVKAMLLK